MTSHLSVCVIGHVNHGKTALVRALTGMECDRLPEEIARGMSMTLGFAYRSYGPTDIDFIDSPGHEDFIRAMIAGASGAQAALLVVSATEGVRRQSLEHARIADLLGIRALALIISKADLCPPEERHGRETEIREAIGETPFADAPAIWTSSVTGEGLDYLHNYLADVTRTADPLPDPEGFRLAIDRVFSVRGSGVVVTGTLTGGSIGLDEGAVLMPSGLEVRIRQIQVHGQPTPTAVAGARTALNLRGIEPSAIQPGDTICKPGALRPSNCIDVKLSAWKSDPDVLRHLSEVRVMSGTRSDIARLHHLDRTPPSESALEFVRLTLREPVCVLPGQRLLLRALSPSKTLCGAVVIDPAPPLRKSTPGSRLELLRVAEDRNPVDVARVLFERDRGSASVEEVARLSCLTPALVKEALGPDVREVASGIVANENTIRVVETRLLQALRLRHAEAPTRPFLPLRPIREEVEKEISRDLVNTALLALTHAGLVRIRDSEAALADHDPAATLRPSDMRRMDRIEDALKAGGLNPPDLGDLLQGLANGQELLDILLAQGKVVDLYNHALRRRVILHVGSLETAREELSVRFPNPERFTTGEAREALGTTRRIIVPLLERLDQLGYTRREGDTRTLCDPTESRAQTKSS